MFKTEIKTKVKTRKTTAMCDTNLFRESEFKPTNITDDYWLHCSLVVFLEMAGIRSLFFWQNVFLLWQSLSYWLREILGMLGFVWVFTFYIEFGGEISPFIFKLAGKQQRFSGDQRLWEAKAQRTVLPASQLSCRGKSKLISLPPKFFIPPPSYLIAQPNILTFFAPFLWNNTVLVHS